MHTRTLAPIVAAALAAGALAPAGAAEPANPTSGTAAETKDDTKAGQEGKEMATGPGSTEFTKEETDNALRFLGLLVGVGALLITVIGGIAVFAGPHLGLKLPQPPRF